MVLRVRLESSPLVICRSPRFLRQFPASVGAFVRTVLPSWQRRVETSHRGPTCRAAGGRDQTASLTSLIRVMMNARLARLACLASVGRLSLPPLCIAFAHAPLCTLRTASPSSHLSPPILQHPFSAISRRQDSLWPLA